MTRTRWVHMKAEAVIRKAGYRCTYCRTVLGHDWHIDHRIPVVLGGTDHPNNLAAACPSCNLRKGTRTAAEFLEELAENGETPAGRAVGWARRLLRL